MMVFQGSD